MTSREQFEEWFSNDVVGADVTFPDFEDGEYIAGEVYDDQLYIMLQAMWLAWQASRAEIGVDHPVCWRTYYPDTEDEIFRAHSESNESCAKRIASEIGGYVVPVYHGKPVNVEVKK